MQRPHCLLAGCGIDFRVEWCLVDFVNSDSPLIGYWGIFHNKPPFVFCQNQNAHVNRLAYTMLHSYIGDTEMGKRRSLLWLTVLYHKSQRKSRMRPVKGRLSNEKRPE